MIYLLHNINKEFENIESLLLGMNLQYTFFSTFNLLYRALKKQAPDLIILNATEHENHYQFINKCLTEFHPTTTVPILIISSNTSVEVIENSYLKGATSYIYPPFINSAIESQITLLIERTKLLNNETIETPDTSLFNNTIIKNYQNIKQTNQQLNKQIEIIEEEKDLFELLFNLLPEAVAISRLHDGQFAKVNSGFLKLFGYSPLDIKNKTCVQTELWTQPEKRAQYIKELKDGEIIEDFDACFKTKDGKIVCSKISSILFNYEGEKHILSAIRDNSKQKALEEELKENINILYETQNIGELGSYNLNFATGKWTSSEMLDTIFGIDKNYDRSIPNWLKIIHPKWRVVMKTYLEEDVINQHKKFNKQYKIVRIKDKAERWVHGRGILHFNAKGELIEMAGTIIDITTHKNIETELNNERKLLNNILETSPVGIVLVNKEGSIYYANKRGEQILNLTASNNKQLHYNSPQWKITDWEGNEFPESQLPFVLVKKHLKPVYNIKHAIEDKNGVRKMIAVNASPILDGNQVFNGMISTLEDITLQKIAEIKIQQQNSELSDLNTMKDKLFSILSHDLKAPIGSMYQITKILSNDIESFDPSDRVRILKSLEQVSDQAYQLIENLLEWSRLEQGLIKPNIRSIAITNIINHAEELLKTTATDKKITIIKDIDPSFEVWCDVQMTQTIIRNILSNAIKFSKPEQSIEIVASKKESVIEIDIIDKGVGIASENLSLLFSYTENKSTAGTGREIGTGLGLPLCKDLIERQQGTIYVKETSKKGTTLSFTLPLFKNEM